MELKRPIIFFDTETTGVDVDKDKIIQLACVKIMPNNEVVKKDMYFNPGIKIPEDSTVIHGIDDDFVKDKHPFKKYAKSIYTFFDGCDLGGCNSDSFDIPILSKEFRMCGISWPSDDVVTVDIYKIECAVNKRDLSSMYERYMNDEFPDAHNAAADTDAAVDVFFEQIRQRGLPDDIQKLQELGANGKERVDWAGKLYKEDGVVKYSFGPHRDKPVLDDIGFANWMLSKDFPRETKDHITDLLNSID